MATAGEKIRNYNARTEVTASLLAHGIEPTDRLVTELANRKLEAWARRDRSRPGR